LDALPFALLYLFISIFAKLLSSNEVEVIEERKKTLISYPQKRESKRRVLILIPKSSNYLGLRKKKALKRFWPTYQKKSQRKRKEDLMKH